MLLAIIAATVALAGLILNGHRGLTQRMDRLEDRLASVEREQAHLAGLKGSGSYQRPPRRLSDAYTLPPQLGEHYSCVNLAAGRANGCDSDGTGLVCGHSEGVASKSEVLSASFLTLWMRTSLIY